MLKDIRNGVSEEKKIVIFMDASSRTTESADASDSSDKCVETPDVIRPMGRVAFRGKTGRVRLTAEQRRNQILDAASNIISYYGYRGFTIRQVADACGVTEPSVIYHFKSKESLMVAVLVRRDANDMASLAANLGIKESDLWLNPVSFNLRELCTALIEGNVEQPELVRLYTVMQAESLNAEHPAFDFFQQREQWVINMFARAAAHEGFNEPTRVAKIFLSQMDGMQIRWLRDIKGFDLAAEWEEFSRRFA